MAGFTFIGRYSISNVDFTVVDATGTIVNSDAAPVAEYRNYATNALVFSRSSVQVTNPGVYRLTLSSVETGNPGLYFVNWIFNLATIPQQFRTDIEIPSSTSTLYDQLSEDYQAIVDEAWDLFEDLFDSAVGGPHLMMYAQSDFGRERVAQLLRVALGRLNTTSQPHQTFTLEANDFPFAEWSGLLRQATTIEIIKHLMRSYVEQPDAQGVSPARLDRRDYLSRWGDILRMEEEPFKEALSVYKMAAMNLGRGSVLVAGGLYGNYGPSMNPARPRYMPTFRRW